MSMTRVWYIGDEATSAGYRLAGVERRIPAEGETAEVFRRAVADGAELILLSAERAPEIDAAELEAALLALHPLTAIVPDALGRSTAPDVEREVRLALGIEP
jgi:vacuolar-type H+-ATPase subunit F/Vma7